jgi:hypothetical protein
MHLKQFNPCERMEAGYHGPGGYEWAPPHPENCPHHPGSGGSADRVSALGNGVEYGPIHGSSHTEG